LLEHGFLDFIVPRTQLKETLSNLLQLIWDKKTTKKETT